MVNVLTQLRTDVADALETGGITAKTYVPSNLYPPMALVSADATYVSTPIGDNPFRDRHSVGLQVLLLGGNAMNESALEAVDELIVDAIDALSNWDVTEVTAPFEFSTTEGYTFTAAMLTIQTNTSIERDD